MGQASLRVHKDLWRYDLNLLTKGNPTTIYPELVDKDRYPIFHYIASSWDKFRTEFIKLNENCLASNILNNPLLVRSRQDGNRLDFSFFRQNPPLPGEIISQLKVKDFWTGGRMKNLAQINLDCGINFNLVTYIRIGTALNLYFNRQRQPRTSDGSSMSMELFC